MWPSDIAHQRVTENSRRAPAARRQGKDGNAAHDRAAGAIEQGSKSSSIGASIPEEESAVQDFVKTHMPSMTAIAERLLGDQAAAEDCVQEAFFKLSRTAGVADEFSSLQRWLHHTVISQALLRLRILREEKARQKGALPPELHTEIVHVYSPWRQLAAPVRELADGDRSTCILEQIKHLPECDRRLLQLHDVREWSKRDVADALDLTESEVCARLPKARARLMRLLEPLLCGST